ncbi:hypothetical protein ACFVY4_13970, partial [Streptomyces sp. NPDC058299]
MSPRAGHPGHPAHTLAFVESPVQLLNVLEWAHAHGLRGTAEQVRPVVPAQVRPVVPAQARPVVPAQARPGVGGPARAGGGAPGGGGGP